MIKNGWNLDNDIKDWFISTLTPELAVLRMKAEISQGDLANIIGVSRQTYNAIECGTRKLPWNAYLALIFYYDYNQKTRQMIRTLGIFPQGLISKINNDSLENGIIDLFLPEEMQDIISMLDEQAFRSIRTIIMVEYGRCTGLSGDAIVKLFSGITFPQIPTSTADVAVKKAISKIRGRNIVGK